MDPRAKAAFISGYTKILTQAWSSDEFAARLVGDPVTVLAENGLEVPAGARVEIVRSRDAEPDLEAQIALWADGAATGRYVLYVPDTPVIETRELSENDLDAVAGGGDTCCCCCPCCSCA